MINKILIFLLLGMIKIYQRFISPFLGSNCRFYPTCSYYSMQAIQKWGILKGGWLSIKRIVRCNPWGGSGIDEIPKKNKK